jgi:SAM-dependent methyltransferase
MMFHIGAPNVENFFVVADAWAQVLSHYIAPNSHIMDIGSGCGRTARLLAINPYILLYTGFDVIAPYVEWCNRFFNEIYPGRFNFYHLDVKTQRYNPFGKLTGKTAVFPGADSDVDLIFAASLFTHLFPEDARYYMRESKRVLKSGGKAVFSIHEEPQPGKEFSGTEVRADYELNYFIRLMRDEGYEFFEDVGELCGQRALVFVKP